jgi:hypothetical protein
MLLLECFVASGLACVEEHPNWDHTTSSSSSEVTDSNASEGSSVTGSSEEDGSESSGSSGPSEEGTDTEETTGPVPSCTELWQSGEVVLEPAMPIDAINEEGFDGDPFLGYDQLTLYFASDRGPPPTNWNIYASQRASVDDAFGPPVLFGEVNSDQSEWAFAPSSDGTLALFISDRLGNANIWQVDRASPTEAWQAPMEVSELNTPDYEFDVWMSPDGLHAAFERLSGANGQIYWADRLDVGDPFDEPYPLALNTSDDNDSPSLTEDLLVIVFGSTRPGGAGGHDLWYATREVASEAFGPAQPIPGINTEGDERELHLRADGCELIFGRSDDPVGEYDLYQARVVAP